MRVETTSKKKLILLGVTGSIAAVKAPDLVRRLSAQGYLVQCLMTPSAEQFVSQMALATFSGRDVLSRMFDDKAYQMPHIQLAIEADLMVVAPASASILARCAQGLADDMVSLTYLTTTAPVLMVPAMHDTMWQHPATQQNVSTLKKRGNRILGPVVGSLADESLSTGRMVEPSEIVSAVEKILNEYAGPKSVTSR